jgi:hypothetical protein
VKSVQQGTDRYKASAGTAQSSWLAGIQGTQKDQAALAVAAIPRMVAGFNDAANSGRIAAGLTRRGTGYWKTQSEAKQSSYGTGIMAGANNYANAAAKLYPAIANAVSSLPARGDINANLARSRALALALHAGKGQYKAG